jgi:predicted nucleotidyltransferase
MDSILNSFKLQDHLNPEIWGNAETDDFGQIKLNSEMRASILKIAHEFVQSIKVDEIEVEDVLFVGSLANFNWSKYSDVDIHIVMDKSKLGANQDVVDELLDSKKDLFKFKHDITIKGFEVELYAQDIDETLDSNGQYSVLFNKWEMVPNKEEFDLDKKNIITKIKEFNKALTTIEKMKDSDQKVVKLKKLKDKISAYRQAGLEKTGELSDENLVFKYLRRSGFMDKLSDIKNNTQDTILTVENIEL